MPGQFDFLQQLAVERDTGALWDATGDKPLLGGLTALQGQALVQGAWNVGLNAITSPPRIPTVGAIGDSIILNMTTSQSGSFGGYVGVQRRPDQRYAWIHWACAYSGICMPDIYAFEGFSGKKTDEILAACTTASATETVGASDTIAIGTQARTPDIVVDMSGTNDLGLATLSDLTTGAALSRCIAGRVAIWNFIKQCGGRPIALSLLPRQGS